MWQATGINTMLTGDVDTGQAILHDHIKATLREAGRRNRRAAQVHDPNVRLARQSAGPQPVRLFGIIGYLQQQAGLELHLTPGLR